MARETVDEIHQLPEGLSVGRVPKEKRPTQNDWVRIQGGMPEIEWESDVLCKVIHRYENTRDPTGTGRVVVTSLLIVEKWKIKTVTYNIDGKEKVFPIGLLWQFHGKPNWISGGGRGGERVPIK